jgi:hypothetical protein
VRSTRAVVLLVGAFLAVGAVAGVFVLRDRWPDFSTPTVTGEVRTNEFGDLASALGIVRYVGRFEFSQPVAEAGLRFKFYRDGKCIRVEESTRMVGGVGGGRFAIHLIDRDRFPASDGDKGHLVLRCELGSSGAIWATGSTDLRIAKGSFRIGTGSFTRGAFEAKLGAGDVALFFRVADDQTAGGCTPLIPAVLTAEGILAANPRGDIVIASLTVK